MILQLDKYNFKDWFLADKEDLKSDFILICTIFFAIHGYCRRQQLPIFKAMHYIWTSKYFEGTCTRNALRRYSQYMYMIDRARPIEHCIYWRSVTKKNDCF